MVGDIEQCDALCIYIYSPHLHRAYSLMFKAEINQNVYLLIVQGELRVVYENTVQSELI